MRALLEMALSSPDSMSVKAVLSALWLGLSQYERFLPVFW